MDDLISRDAAIKAACKGLCHPGLFCPDTGCKELEPLKRIPAAERWIPCSERLPEGISPVLITWKNNNPAPYYRHIKGKPFSGAAHYCRGKWWWYSSVTEDYLEEYGGYDPEIVDEEIEVIAWMPLPEPYKGEQDG